MLWATMQLSSDILMELLGHTDAVLEQPGPRRESGRIPIYRIGTQRRCAGASPPSVVTIRNISAYGLGLLQQWPMTVGEKFQLSLVLQDDSPLDLHAVVAWCRPSHDGSYLVGAEFIHPPAQQDELRAVG